MARKSIIEELCDILDIEQRRNEDRQKFLLRLVTAAMDCSEETWESIPEPAQNWVNAAKEADEKKKEITDPEEPKGSGNDRQRKEKETTEMATAKGKTGGRNGAGKDKDEEKKVEAKKDDKKAGAKSAGKKEEKKAPAKKGTSKRRSIKQLVVKSPGVSVEKLTNQFGGKDGLSDLTISSIRSDTLDTLRVADDAGFWKGPDLG